MNRFRRSNFFYFTFCFAEFFCFVVFRKIVAEFGKHPLLMSRDNVGVLVPLTNVCDINADRKTVGVLSLSDGTKDIFIEHREVKFLRILKHEHLFFVVFPIQNNVSFDVMREDITAEENDFLEGWELAIEELFEKSFELVVLLHKILHR